MRKCWLGQLCGVVNAEAHLQPLVSYCLMLLMKWTFFGTLGPGDPDTFLSLGKKNGRYMGPTLQCIVCVSVHASDRITGSVKLQ